MTNTTKEKLKVLNSLLETLVKYNDKWKSCKAKRKGSDFIITTEFNNSKFFQNQKQVIPLTDIDKIIVQTRAKVYKYENHGIK